MRWTGAVAAALLLTACSDEPDFEARYDKANAEIAARVKALDAAVTEAEDGEERDGAEQDGAEQEGAAPLKLRLPVGQAAARDEASSGE